MTKEFAMRKEWKLDAFLCIKALGNPIIHFNLGNLYMLLRRDERLTEEEIQTFDKLLRKISSSNLEFDIQKELFEDDQFYKDKEKEYEKDHKIRLIFSIVKKEWFEDTEYPENQFDLYVYDKIENYAYDTTKNKYNLNDKEIEEIFNIVMEKSEKYDKLTPYVEKAKMRDERKTICPGE